MSKLEMLDNIQLAHPFNKGFEYEVECNNEDEVMRVIRGENIDQSEANGTAVDSNGKSSKVKAYTTSFYVGLVLDTSKIPSNNNRGPILMESRQVEAVRYFLGLSRVLRYLQNLESI